MSRKVYRISRTKQTYTERKMKKTEYDAEKMRMRAKTNAFRCLFLLDDMLGVVCICCVMVANCGALYYAIMFHFESVDTPRNMHCVCVCGLCGRVRQRFGCRICRLDGGIYDIPVCLHSFRHSFSKIADAAEHTQNYCNGMYLDLRILFIQKFMGQQTYIYVWYNVTLNIQLISRRIRGPNGKSDAEADDRIYVHHQHIHHWSCVTSKYGFVNWKSLNSRFTDICGDTRTSLEWECECEYIKRWRWSTPFRGIYWYNVVTCTPRALQCKSVRLHTFFPVFSIHWMRDGNQWSKSISKYYTIKTFI